MELKRMGQKCGLFACEIYRCYLQWLLRGLERRRRYLRNGDGHSYRQLSPARLHAVPDPSPATLTHPASLLLGEMTLNRVAGRRGQRNFRTGGNAAASQSHIESATTTLFDAGREVYALERRARRYSPKPPDHTIKGWQVPS